MNARTYAANLLKLARQDRHLRPGVVIFYVTGQCNLNCAYCEDFGSRRNPANDKPAPLEQSEHILRIIRSGSDALFLTGGEPLTHPEIDPLIRYAKRNLKFREVTLITNGILLPQHEAALHFVDRLVISLDSTDPAAWSQTLSVSPAAAESILGNIRAYAARQREFGFQMILNCVLSPENLPNAQSVLEFCTEHHVLVSFSPQAVNNWPRYELTVSAEYTQFIETLIRLKNHGAPILGSTDYLRTLAAFQPYDCHPTLAPRIYPNGDLAYPCRPLEKADNGQGGRPVNLLNVHTWDEAWAAAHAAHGPPPRTCHSCFQQCHAEPSLMQSRPLSLLWENIRHPASRKGNLVTYAPG